MYPDNIQYKDAVRNSYFDPNTTKYQFTAVLKEDEPEFQPGNKAIVFKVLDNANGAQKALKFFSYEESERFSRYQHISKYIKGVKSSFFVDFDFDQKLIFVPESNGKQGGHYPGLVMEWAKGVTLGTKLNELCSLNQKKEIAQLTEQFKEMALFLLDNGIAHGDLKHDNIMVSANGKLVLVDYDCLFVPALRGMSSIELGTDSFQHPLRTGNDFNERIDHFSILTIYTSLLALARFPKLYERFNDQQNLLFSDKDFLNPDTSLLFKELAKDTHIKPYAYFIKKSCKSGSIYIDEITDFLKGVFPKPTILISQEPTKAMAGDTVLVHWMTENVEQLNVNGKSVQLQGSLKGEFDIGAKLTFVYGNELLEKTREYKVKLHPRAEIVFFKSDFTMLAEGKSAILSWKVSDAKKVELVFNGSVSLVESKGSMRVTPMADSIYMLSVLSLDNRSRTETKVNIIVRKKIVISSFSAKDSFIVESLKTRLKWDILNAQQISISSNLGERYDNLKGKSLEVQPRHHAVYTIKATNELFSAEAKCEITVDPRPRLDLALPRIVLDNNTLVPDFPVDNLLFENREMSKELFEEVFGKRSKKSFGKGLLERLLLWKR